MKKTSILIIILIAIALLLGVLIYQSTTVSSPRASSEKNVTPSNSSQTPPSLIPEELAVLNFDWENATDEERQQQTARVAELAQRAEALEIGANCSVKPTVFHINAGEIVVIRNIDVIDHEIYHRDTRYSIPAGVSRTIRITDLFGGGLPGYMFGYGCDDLPNSVGILFIAQ